MKGSLQSSRKCHGSLFTKRLLPLAMLAVQGITVHAATNIDESLETVTVYGSGYRTTGTKSDLLPMESPMSFEIYDNELLELRQVDSINEALRYVPGVTTESRATATLFDQYNIRGFDSYFNYYDGLPLQYNGLWNLVPQVDAFATQSIEVLKGPTSVLYGSAPPGGMINQTAKQPQSDSETRIRLRAGTNDLVELGVDSTGAITDSLDYRVIALGRARDGQQVTTKEERKVFAPSVTWQIGERTSLNLNAYYQDDPKAIPSTPLPSVGTLHSAPYGKLDSEAYAGDANWNNFNRTVTMLGYKFSHDFSDSVTFLQNLRYTDGKALQKNTYGDGLDADEQTYFRSAYLTDETIEGLAVDNQLAIKFQTGEIEHKLLVGIDYQTLDSDVHYGDTLGINTPALDLGNPDYNLFNPASMPLDYYTEDHDIQQDQLGIYLQDEIHWDKLTIIVGTRWDDYESTDKAANVYAGAAYGNTTDIDQEQFSSRLAAIYTLDNGLAPYIGYSESFEPTSGVDSLTGKAFEPTTAKQLEAGLKYQAPSNNLELTAAIFELQKENVVVNTPAFNQYTQNGEVTSTGVELSAQYSPIDSLQLTATYNYQDVEVSDNPLDPAVEGKTPTWVAKQQASLWAQYFLTDSLMLGGGVRYVGERQLNKYNTDQIPSFTLFDLVATYRLNSTYDVSLSANNIADKRYVSACFDVMNCWMGAERSVELTFNARF